MSERLERTVSEGEVAGLVILLALCLLCCAVVWMWRKTREAMDEEDEI